MIDTDKYEETDHPELEEFEGETLGDMITNLLAEVKRLRSLGMGTGTDGTEATGWVKKINSLNAEVKRLRDHIRRMRHWAEPKMQEVHHDAWRKLHEEIYEGDD